jgi:ribosomal protein L30E
MTGPEMAKHLNKLAKKTGNVYLGRKKSKRRFMVADKSKMILEKSAVTQSNRLNAPSQKIEAPMTESVVKASKPLKVRQ